MVIKSQTFTFYVSYIRIYISDLIITVRNVVAARLCFSQASVILFTEGGVHGRGHVWQGACMVGACMAGGVCVVGACMAGAMATAVDSMHPTGMHSCCPR